MTTLFKFKAT